MADALRQEHWQHTSLLTSLIANANRDPKRKPSPFMPDDCNPMADRRAKGKVVTEQNMDELKEAFESFRMDSK